MPEFLWFDASYGEDDDHLQAVYKMADGSMQFVPKKNMAQFENSHKNEKPLMARIADLEQRVAVLEAALTPKGR